MSLPTEERSAVTLTAALVATLEGDGPPAGLDLTRDLEPAAAALGHGPVRWALGVAHRTADVVVRANPDNPDMPAAEIAGAARTMLLELLGELSGQHVPTRLSSNQLEIVRDAAARDIPADRIVSSLRLVQQEWTDLLIDAAPPLEAGTLRRIVQVTSRYFDGVVDGVIGEYVRERERLATGRAADRAALIEAVMAGEPVGDDVARDRLGIDPRRPLLAMVLRTLRPGSSAHVRGELRRTAELLTRAARAEQSLSHAVADDELWVWIGLPHRWPPDATSTLQSMTDIVRERGHRVIIGSERTGVAGMRRTMTEARSVDRLDLRPGPGVVSHQEVDLAVLVGGDRERARWFVQDHLGALAGADPANAELRETLARYFSSGMSLVAAAPLLHVHRNTVVYRLRRIEQILGHPVSENVLPIRCALLLVAEFGKAVLDPDPQVRVAQARQPLLDPASSDSRRSRGHSRAVSRRGDLPRVRRSEGVQ